MRGVRPVGAGALVEQLVQLFPGAALDDRAVGVALDASIAGVKGLVQQYYCAVFPGVVCAVRVQHCAAAAGDHSILCAERPDRLSLFLPEIRFAVLGENVRDGLAFLFYDISVCVDQRQPQLRAGHYRDPPGIEFVLIAAADAADGVGPAGGCDAGNQNAEGAVALDDFPRPGAFIHHDSHPRWGEFHRHRPGGGHDVAPVGRSVVAGDQNGWAVVEQAAGVLQFNVAKAAHRRSLNNGSVGR